jgi:hypothetical protein
MNMKPIYIISFLFFKEKPTIENNHISINENLTRFDDIITETHYLYNSLSKCFEEYKYDKEDSENLVNEVWSWDNYIINFYFLYFCI